MRLTNENGEACYINTGDRESYKTYFNIEEVSSCLLTTPHHYWEVLALVGSEARTFLEVALDRCAGFIRDLRTGKASRIASVATKEVYDKVKENNEGCRDACIAVIRRIIESEENFVTTIPWMKFRVDEFFDNNKDAFDRVTNRWNANWNLESVALFIFYVFLYLTSDLANIKDRDTAYMRKELMKAFERGLGLTRADVMDGVLSLTDDLADEIILQADKPADKPELYLHVVTIQNTAKEPRSVNVCTGQKRVLPPNSKTYALYANNVCVGFLPGFTLEVDYILSIFGERFAFRKIDNESKCIDIKEMNFTPVSWGWTGEFGAIAASIDGKVRSQRGVLPSIPKGRTPVYVQTYGDFLYILLDDGSVVSNDTLVSTLRGHHILWMRPGVGGFAAVSGDRSARFLRRGSEEVQCMGERVTDAWIHNDRFLWLDADGVPHGNFSPIDHMTPTDKVRAIALTGVECILAYEDHIDMISHNGSVERREAKGVNEFRISADRNAAHIMGMNERAEYVTIL